MARDDVIERLDDAEPSIRRDAARELYGVATDGEGLRADRVAVLVDRTADEDDATRAYANGALTAVASTDGEIGPPVESLVVDCSDGSPAERRRATALLGWQAKAERSLPSEAVEALVAVLGDDSDVRLEAARALFHVSRNPHVDLDAAVRPLAELLDDVRPVIRAAATAVLGELVGFDPENDPSPVLSDLLDRLDDEDDAVRQTALGVFYNTELAYLPDDRALERAVVGLASCIESDDDLIRERGTAVLSDIVGNRPGLVRSVVPDVFEAIGKVDGELFDVDVRDLSTAARKDPLEVVPLVPALRAHLYDEDKYARKHAATALGWVARTYPNEVLPAVPSLFEALSDPTIFVRRTAAWALAEVAFTYPDDVPPEVLPLVELKRDISLDLSDDAFWPLAAIAAEHPEHVVRVFETMIDAALASDDRSSPLGIGLSLAEVHEVNPTVIPRVIAPLVDALHDSDVIEQAEKVLTTLGEEHPETMVPVADGLVAAIQVVDGYPRWQVIERLVHVAVLDPDALVDAADQLVDVLTDPNTGARHDAAAVLAVLAYEHPEDVPSIAEALAAYLEREHPGRFDDPDRLQYVGPDHESNFPAPYLKDDPAWSLGVVAEVDPERVELAVDDLAERIRDEDFWGDFEDQGEAIAEIAATRSAFVGDAVAALASRLDDEDSRIRERAVTGLAAVARFAPDLVKDSLPDTKPDVDENVLVELAEALAEGRSGS